MLLELYGANDHSLLWAIRKVNRRKNKHFKKTRKKKRVRKLENKKKLLEKERECAAKTVVKL